MPCHAIALIPSCRNSSILKGIEYLKANRLHITVSYVVLRSLESMAFTICQFGRPHKFCFPRIMSMLVLAWIWTSATGASVAITKHPKSLTSLHTLQNLNLRTTTSILLSTYTNFPRTNCLQSETYLQFQSLLNTHNTSPCTKYNNNTQITPDLSLVATMATSAIQNPEVPTESKTAKKKRERAEAAAAAAALSHTPTEVDADPESTNDDGSYESPYVKELYK